MAFRPWLRFRPRLGQTTDTGNPNEPQRALREKWLVGRTTPERVAAPPADLGARISRPLLPSGPGGVFCRASGKRQTREIPTSRSERCGKSGSWAERPRKEWRPRRLTSAPASVDTVAAFRPWRSFRHRL